MSTQMLLDRICSECDYWLRIAQGDTTNLYAINGELFELIPGEIDPIEKPHYILTEDDVFITTHLFNFGRIPENFIATFPQKARFINLRQYKKIFSRPNFRCHRKGCLGRKQCWWYRGEENFNEIPKRIKENPEDCKLFIKKIK